MRLRPIALLATTAAVLAAAAPAPAAPLFQSDNVELVTKLPEAVGAIGARFSPDGDTMYVTSATGLLIYDVSTPEAPAKLSQIALPHFENEDVDVGHVAGRDIVVISNDPSFTAVGIIYVFDVTDPTNPQRIATKPTEVPLVGSAVGAEGTTNGHIASCIQDCRYLWTTGSAEGVTVYDLADPTAPKHLGAFTMPGDGFTHDVDVDDTGVAWVTGEDGTFAFQPRASAPLKPTLIARSDDRVVNSGNSGPLSPETAEDGPLDFLHHNSKRTKVNLTSNGTANLLESRRGNVVVVTEEDYTRPGCPGQGSLQTWRLHGTATNADGSRRLELLDLETTELNELAELRGRSNPYGAPTTANCSAHWFDEDAGLVAQGWYDQGVRFWDITDPRNITPAGYYVTAGTFWAAYFAPADPEREIVYGLDTAGGIDVLRIDRDAPVQPRELPAEQAETLLDRLASLPNRFVAHVNYGMACPILKSVTTGLTVR